MVVAERRATRPVPDTVELHAPDGIVREFRSYGGRVGRFIETYCCFTKGKYRGRPFTLENWQWQLLDEVFEVVPDAEFGWRRKYREAYIEISKKQGKTELIAAIDLYLLAADFEESPEIACCANSEEQADLVFGAARAMVELGSSSRAAARGLPHLGELVALFQRELVLKENPAAKIIRVSATVGTNDGKNLSGITIDEFHEFPEGKGAGLYGVLTNATVMRDEPLTLIITTAGPDKPSPCLRMHRKAERVLRGSTEDPAFYARFYCAQNHDLAPDNLPDLVAALKEANPNFDVTVHLDFYLDRLRKVSWAVFCRFFLGWWMRDTASRWLPPGAWDECRVADCTLILGEPLYVGVDAGLVRDATSVCMVQPQGGQFRALWKRWKPPVSVATGLPAEGWRTPLAEIEAFLLDLGARFAVRVIAYDPFALALLMREVGEAGLPVVEWPQTDSRMVPATTATRDLIMARRLEHDGDPETAEQVADAVAKASRNRTGDRIVKTADRKPNDDVIALVMAVGEALRQQPAEVESAPFIYVLGGGDHDAA